jgi:hypothetical protein
MGRTRQPCAPYIHRWRHVTDEYMSRIFISDVAPPMNIWDGSKSNLTAHIFVSLGTDEYNWNIFVGTDE